MGTSGSIQSIFSNFHLAWLKSDKGTSRGVEHDRKTFPLNLTQYLIRQEIFSLLKVALRQKVDFPNCPKWVTKKLSWDLENENSDSFLRLQV